MVTTKLVSFKFYPEDIKTLDLLCERLKEVERSNRWYAQKVNRTEAVRRAIKECLAKHAVPTSDNKTDLPGSTYPPARSAGKVHTSKKSAKRKEKRGK